MWVVLALIGFKGVSKRMFPGQVIQKLLFFGKAGRKGRQRGKCILFYSYSDKSDENGDQSGNWLQVPFSVPKIGLKW